MKNLIISLYMLLSFSPFNNLYSQFTAWENISNQIPGDSLNFLSDASVPNRWVGFISSLKRPEIYRSVFSTGTWDALQTPSPVTAFHIIYYDYGFMCGVDSAVYQTTNAGETWDYFGSLGEPINDIDFTYDFSWNGYICGDNGVVGIIKDTGLVVINSGINGNFSNISSPLMDRVWLLGDSSIYFYDGAAFTKQFTSSGLLNSIYFTNELYGWVVGDSGYIASTSDGGNSWLPNKNPDTLKRNLNDIYMISNYGWIVGTDGLILTTIGAGENWIIDADWITSNNLIGVRISGGSREFGPGLAVGENKTALIWPVVVSVDDEPTFVDNFQLYQNYPNPFNPITIIKYSIPPVTLRQAQSDIVVTIKVYDVLGVEVAALVNEDKTAGEYEVEFDGTGLTSGIYFYQLRTGSFIKTKKMVLLK